VFHDLEPDEDAARAEILRGLRLPQKEISSKYLYDERGSALFDQICELPEYYLTRVELEIMRRDADAMAEALGPRCLLIEYGSGSGVKTRLLLDALRAPAAYVPIDIAGEHLRAAAEELFARYPDLDVLPVRADFTHALEVPEPRRPVRRRAVYFPGSTIGNFGPAGATRLLRGIAALCGPGGGLLIGVDLKKDPAALLRAYSDAQGVTRAFNLNLLARLNRELDADFDLDQFQHHAFYNAAAGRMESYLVSLREQTVTVAGRAIPFRQGETIHTENSYKYDLDQFRAMAASVGLAQRQVWTDEGERFSVQHLVVERELEISNCKF
jgi:dimethylhistidine N-methyltransferase